MSLTKNFTFDLASNYTYDDTLIEVVDEVTQLLDVSGVYPITNPALSTEYVLQMSDLLSFTETSVKTGADEIKYILSKDGVDYYFNVSWMVSDGSYLQANTAAEIEANKEIFAIEAETVLISKIFLHSEDSTTTPVLSNLEILYTFEAPEAPDVHTTILYWNAKDTSGDSATDTVSIELVNDMVKYGDKTIMYKETVTVTPVSGFYQFSTADTESMALDRNSVEQKYKLTIGSKTYYINISKVDSINLFDLITL